MDLSLEPLLSHYSGEFSGPLFLQTVSPTAAFLVTWSASLYRANLMLAFYESGSIRSLLDTEIKRKRERGEGA